VETKDIVAKKKKDHAEVDVDSYSSSESEMLYTLSADIVAWLKASRTWGVTSTLQKEPSTSPRCAANEASRLKPSGLISRVIQIEMELMGLRR
jgi:hypothetical protein